MPETEPSAAGAPADANTDQPRGGGSAAGNQAVHVRFDGVQKTYDGETLVVKDLNLDIYSGEFLTMLGPSGSGKTTCLMMLAGFETATKGEIYLSDRPINMVPPHKRGIGMVFQSYALFPHMSVHENLAFPLKVRNVPESEIDRKVTKALGMVRLEGFAGRRPGQLSGGQQQRVAVARALVFEPQLVLMDEPLGALDKNLREQMQFELKHIHEDVGITFVYVTHDQGEALTMSDRIAVFNDGIIQQLADPSTLYEKPENSFVARFIGENNSLHAKVVDQNGRYCTCLTDGGDTIVALPVNAKPSEPTSLSLRPERIIIDPPADAECENRFTAKIEELIYLGDHIRGRLSLLGSDEFVVKIPNQSDTHDLRISEEVAVGWRAEDCRALDSLP